MRKHYIILARNKNGASIFYRGMNESPSEAYINFLKAPIGKDENINDYYIVEFTEDSFLSFATAFLTNKKIISRNINPKNLTI